MAFTEIANLAAPASGVFDFDPLDVSGYDTLQILLSGLVGTDGIRGHMTFYVGGVEITSGYRWTWAGWASSASSVSAESQSDSKIAINSSTTSWGPGNAAGESMGSVIYVFDPASTSVYKNVLLHNTLVGPSGVVEYQRVAGVMENVGAINGLKIAGSANWSSGKVRILGL